MSLRSHPIPRLAVLLAATLTGQSALAQGANEFPFDRFTITAGSFYETTDSDLRLDAGTVNTGTPINLERDLSLDDSDQLVRLGLEWRPFNRSQFSASYYKVAREGGRTLEREIEFGDTVFPVDAAVETDSDFEFFELYYTFWAAKTPRGGLGLSLGVSAVTIDTSLTAEVNAPVGSGTLRLEESASTDLPVPILGVEGRYALTPRFMIAGNVGVLPKVQIEDYEGEALVYGAQLEYRLARNFGLGASWTSFNIEADVERERFLGSLDFTIEGAQAFLRFAF